MLGLLFPILFIPAALIIWSVISDLRDPPPSEPTGWYARRRKATVDDPNWKEYFVKFCESPAETAFLDAMIDAYGLVPIEGLLKGDGLSLNLQVKEPPYRVDFLANDWLVIEIDGAAFHSSPEAVANDQARDEFLRTKGYTVIRIPAKVVFNDSAVAVRRVWAAIAEGKTPKEQDSDLISVQEETDALEHAVTEMNRRIGVRTAYNACSVLRMAFYIEESVVAAALKAAKEAISTEDFCAQSAEHARLYREAYDEALQAVEEHLQSHGEPARPRNVVIPPFVPPPVHADAVINESIQRTYRSLADERARFFEKTRRRLRGDSRLRAQVRAKLERDGHGAIWDAIS